MILFNKPAKEIYLRTKKETKKKKIKPSKKAKAGIIDKTNIDEIKTHVVSPVLIQSDVPFANNIFYFNLII